MIALLPIKEHSERIPDKNWRLFCGRPLYHWILDTLLLVPVIEEVVINTDSERIEGGPRVRVRKRRPELCGDHVSMARIVADDVAATSGRFYLQTHATNPLISTETIRVALEKYTRALYDDPECSFMSANRIQSRLYRADGTPINHNPGDLIRTQDLAPVYEENSCLYLFSREVGLRGRVGTRAKFFETPPLESIDIDTESDWKLAESLCHGR